MADALLEVRGLVKSFGGLIATNRVDANVREGETEVSKPVSLLYDRREALIHVDQRAREVFAQDPPSIRVLDELAAPFLVTNVIYDQPETDYRRIQAQGGVATYSTSHFAWGAPLRSQRKTRSRTSGARKR